MQQQLETEQKNNSSNFAKEFLYKVKTENSTVNWLPVFIFFMFFRHG